jgi:hypothetical protein
MVGVLFIKSNSFLCGAHSAPYKEEQKQQKAWRGGKRMTSDLISNHHKCSNSLYAFDYKTSFFF